MICRACVSGAWPYGKTSHVSPLPWVSKKHSKTDNQTVHCASWASSQPHGHPRSCDWLRTMFTDHLTFFASRNGDLDGRRVPSMETHICMMFFCKTVAYRPQVPHTDRCFISTYEVTVWPLTPDPLSTQASGHPWFLISKTTVCDQHALDFIFYFSRININIYVFSCTCLSIFLSWTSVPLDPCFFEDL